MNIEWAALMEAKATAAHQQITGQQLAKAVTDRLHQIKAPAKE